MRELTEAQRRFIWKAMREWEPFQTVLPMPSSLQQLVDDHLVEKRFSDDENGDETWCWEITPAGRTALNPPAREGEGDHG